MHSNPDLTKELRNAALAGGQAERNRSIEQVRGEDGWDQYNRGYNTYWLKSMGPQTAPAPAAQ